MPLPSAINRAARPAPRLEFKGVFPAPPTPVTEDGRVHEKALRALLLDNIAHGANGFWMAGSTG